MFYFYSIIFMIPKTIHFCWLSGETYPELVCKCIKSWELILPDYEIILWDTQKIDIYSNLWLEQSYKKRNMLLLLIIFVFMHCIIMEEYILMPM